MDTEAQFIDGRLGRNDFATIMFIRTTMIQFPASQWSRPPGSLSTSSSFQIAQGQAARSPHAPVPKEAE
jgi:hypothetical protein